MREIGCPHKSIDQQQAWAERPGRVHQ